MKENITVNSTISADSARELLYGMRQFCEGVGEGVFGWTLDHYLKADDRLTKEQNAYDFLLGHFNQLAGAFRMIAASSAIICEAVTNGDLQIIEGGREE